MELTTAEHLDICNWLSTTAKRMGIKISFPKNLKSKDVHNDIDLIIESKDSKRVAELVKLTKISRIRTHTKHNEGEYEDIREEGSVDQPTTVCGIFDFKEGNKEIIFDIIYCGEGLVDFTKDLCSYGGLGGILAYIMSMKYRVVMTSKFGLAHHEGYSYSGTHMKEEIPFDKSTLSKMGDVSYIGDDRVRMSINHDNVFKAIIENCFHLPFAKWEEGFEDNTDVIDWLIPSSCDEVESYLRIMEFQRNLACYNGDRGVFDLLLSNEFLYG